MKTIGVLLFVSAMLSAYADGSRILISAPYGTKSHQNIYVTLMKELTRRGHHVTFISNYEASELKSLAGDGPSNVRQIIFNEFQVDYSKFPNIFTTASSATAQLKSTVLMFGSLLDRPVQVASLFYKDARVKQLMAQDHFDLVMVSFVAGGISYPLAWHFKSPFIVISPNFLLSPFGTVLGDSDHTEHVPMLFTSFTDRMTLLQRLINSVATWICDIVLVDWNLSTIQKLINQEISDCPPILEIEKNVSLMFTNTHPSFTYPRALTPDVVEIGAIHCSPAQSLSAELEEFVSSSEDGFIIFAVGSTLPMNDMPETILTAFINAFARLPQRVIWQWKGTPRSNLPKNIKAISWLPQQDLLGHKNCRLFLTHGGLNSLQEAMYHAVPVLGLPFGTDQNLNMGRATREGYALKLDWKDVTEETLSISMAALINNSSFSENAKRISSLLRDEMQTPLERAVFWTEFTIRHNGTSHLRLSSRDLTPYQRALIDVYALLFLIISLSLVSVSFCVYKCCRLCRSVEKLKTQ